MSKQKRKQHSVKKSSGVQSTGLLKTLQKIILENSGSISYIFVSEKIENIHSNNLKDMKESTRKTTLHVNLSKFAIEGKSPNDLIHMFETTKNDIGADYYIVN